MGYCPTTNGALDFFDTVNCIGAKSFDFPILRFIAQKEIVHLAQYGFAAHSAA
jgi:hypothetical protein